MNASEIFLICVGIVLMIMDGISVSKPSILNSAKVLARLNSSERKTYLLIQKIGIAADGAVCIISAFIQGDQRKMLFALPCFFIILMLGMVCNYKYLGRIFP